MRPAWALVLIWVGLLGSTLSALALLDEREGVGCDAVVV